MKILERAFILLDQSILFIACHRGSNRLKGSAHCPEVFELSQAAAPLSSDMNLRAPSGDLRGLSHWELNSTISRKLPVPKKGPPLKLPNGALRHPSGTQGRQVGTCRSNFNSTQARPAFPESTLPPTSPGSGCVCNTLRTWARPRTQLSQAADCWMWVDARGAASICFWGPGHRLQSWRLASYSPP